MSSQISKASTWMCPLCCNYSATSNRSESERELDGVRAVAVSKCAVASGPVAAGSTACMQREVAPSPTKLRSQKPSAARVCTA